MKEACRFCSSSVVVFLVTWAFFVVLTFPLWWGLTYLLDKDKEYNTQLITKILAENHVGYSTTEGVSTLEYDILVQDGEKGEKEFKLVDKFSERTYYFVMDKEGNISHIRVNARR